MDWLRLVVLVVAVAVVLAALRRHDRDAKRRFALVDGVIGELLATVRTRTGVDLAADPRRVAIVRAFSVLPDDAFRYACRALLHVGYERRGYRPDVYAALFALGQCCDVYLRETAPKDGNGA